MTYVDNQDLWNTPATIGTQMLDEKELALKWGISVKTLQAWRRLRKGPQYVKLGRSVRYQVNAIAAFESEKLSASTYDYS